MFHAVLFAKLIAVQAPAAWIRADFTIVRCGVGASEGMTRWRAMIAPDGVVRYVMPAMLPRADDQTWDTIFATGFFLIYVTVVVLNIRSVLEKCNRLCTS